MTKELTLDEERLSFFKAKFGEDSDPSKFYIFKCRAISTEPIHQNTIYNGSTVTTGLLSEMEHRVNFTDENIGIHLMHEDQDLNIGRVFHAEVVDEGGTSALYADMAILRTPEVESIIDRIENNVLDEVSVQFLAKKALCSECHFDYMGDEATFENWLEGKCPNDHVIGENGCHLELDGLEWFSEISIVNRGAAHRAKIVSQKREQLFSEGGLMKSLAASGKSPEFIVATFNSKMEKKMDNKDVNTTPDEVAELKAQLEEAQRKLDLAEKVKELEAKLEELSKEIEAKDEELKKITEEKSSVDEELAAAKTEKDQTLAFLKEQVEKVNVAAGKKDVEIPNDLEGISTMLSENQQILVSLIPAGGVSKQVKYGESKNLVNVQIETFRVKR